MLRNKVKDEEPVVYLKRFWKDVHVKEVPGEYEDVTDEKENKTGLRGDRQLIQSQFECRGVSDPFG